MSSIYCPYTYRIYHRPTKMYYYGSKTAKNANPATFWIDYFTSSKRVHQLIEWYGTHTFEIQRIKTFKTKEEAVKWEAKFLQHIDAAHRDNWLNLTNADGKFISNNHTDKTKELMKLRKTIYHPWKGRKHSEISKKKLSETRKRLNLGKAAAKNLIPLYGDKNPMKNPEIAKKLANKITGRRRKYREDGSWFWHHPEK